MSNDVHFLGEYASINDVWKLYPNGGNFGDYILIGEEYIYWNEYTRSWGEQSELEGTVRPAEIVDHDIHVLGKGTFDYGVSFGDYIPGESGADIDGSGNGELRTIKIDNAFIKDPISGQYIALSDYIKKFKTELPPDWDEYSKSILFDDVRILVFDAASNNKYYTTVGDLKKLISDSIGETGGGGGETGTIEVVRSDNPDAILTDNNVLSSLRTLQEISRLENSSHSHSNKDILDKLSQSDLDVLSKLRLVNGKLEIGTDAYSVGEISAFGVGSGTGGGGSSYNRLDAWADYSADKSGWVLSALLGNDLNTRLLVLEAGGSESYQPLDADLTSIAGLTGTNGFLKKIGVNSWELDTNSYALASHTHTFASITSKPTTLSGYGITDAAALNHTHTFSSLTSKPTTLAGYGITNAYTKTETDNKLALKLDKSIFDDLFEKVEISAGVFAIKAKYNFYSVGEVSAYGAGSGTGGGTGVTSLSALTDVALTSPVSGNVLVYNGTHWENKPQSAIVPDLSGYATTEYVDNKVADVDSDKTFRFSQTTPQSVWVVTHNLRKYPSVTVIDSAGTEVIGEVEYIDINTVSIKFAYEFSGYVLCN